MGERSRKSDKRSESGARKDRRSSRATEPAISHFRSDRPGIRKALGDLEADVMEAVWDRPSGLAVTVREIHAALSHRREIAYTTVMTTMARLVRKHLLKVEKAGTAHGYYPALSHDEFVSRMIGRVLQDLLVGFSDGAARGVNARVDPRVLDKARRLIEEISRRRKQEEPE